MGLCSHFPSALRSQVYQKDFQPHTQDEEPIIDMWEESCERERGRKTPTCLIKNYKISV